MGTAFLRQLQQEFKGYNGQKLAKDLMAGLTVAAVALPLALAFGVSAGATAACGLVTAIVAGLIISALTGGYYQISGPTGAMAAILGSLIATYGMQGMFVATFLAGALLILAAVLHLGNLTAFVPAPVITGFTSGIAVIIAMGQIDNFFGTHSEGASAIAKIISYKDLGFHPDIATTLIALFVVLLMVFLVARPADAPHSRLSSMFSTAMENAGASRAGTVFQSICAGDRRSLARTSVAVRSGAQTRLTGIFHAVGLLIMMFLLAPVIQNVPLAGLAGVLMVTAWRMNEWHAIKYMFSHRFKGAMAKFIVTMICTIVFDLTVAIVVGVGLGLILMVARLSKLQINYERVDMSRIKNNDEALSERYRNAMVAYITGPLIFANIDTIEQLTERVGTCDTLLLSMRGVPYIDISAAQALMDILRSLHENGVDIVLCGLPSSAMNMMHRSGIYDMVGEQGFYWSVERALLDLRPHAGKK